MGPGSGGFCFLCPFCIRANVLLDPKAEALADCIICIPNFLLSLWRLFGGYLSVLACKKN